MNTELWEWPQYTWLIIAAVSLLYYARTGFSNLIGGVLGTALSVWLLMEGGFFK